MKTDKNSPDLFTTDSVISAASLRPSTEERFWSKVRRGNLDECWLWLGADNGKGYGKFWKDGRPVRAHRIAWTLTRGPIPKRKQVLHRRDNRGCVNPSHLFLGTNQDNCRDMSVKGRHGSGKLTAAQVDAIRASQASATCLAATYGISSVHIYRIRNGKRWAPDPVKPMEGER